MLEKLIGREQSRRLKPRVANQKTAALTLVEVLVVIVVLAILALVAINTGPGPTKISSGCVNNLKQIGLSYRIWAEDHSGRFPMQVSVTDGGAKELVFTADVAGIFRTLSNELYSPKVLLCPSDKSRLAATNFAAGFSVKNLSYFVGLDAATNHPQMFLSGDDNFAIGGVPVNYGLVLLPTNASIAWTTGRHVNTGNIGFADGSVMQTSPSGLKRMIVETGVATNRLAIP